jgi:cytochrome c oxidase subunit 1/cytochrome c oxidase subunit I+III
VVGYPLIVLSIVVDRDHLVRVWVHHMFATGLPQLSYSFFSAASTIITIPSGLQIFAGGHHAARPAGHPGAAACSSSASS